MQWLMWIWSNIKLICVRGIFRYDILFRKKFEDAKGVIRIRKSKDRQHNLGTSEKKTKKQTMIYKTLHSKQRSSNTNPTTNLCELRWFIRHIYYSNLQFLSNVIIIKASSGIGSLNLSPNY